MDQQEEAQRLEEQRKEAEKKEAERREAERREAERKEAERKEAERKEAERREAERKEAERKEAERREAQRREAERREAERREAERQEAEKKELEKKEAERQRAAAQTEALRQEQAKKQMEMKEAQAAAASQPQPKAQQTSGEADVGIELVTESGLHAVHAIVRNGPAFLSSQSTARASRACQLMRSSTCVRGAADAVLVSPGRLLPSCEEPTELQSLSPSSMVRVCRRAGRGTEARETADNEKRNVTMRRAIPPHDTSKWQLIDDAMRQDEGPTALAGEGELSLPPCRSQIRTLSGRRTSSTALSGIPVRPDLYFSLCPEPFPNRPSSTSSGASEGDDVSSSEGGPDSSAQVPEYLLQQNRTSSSHLHSQGNNFQPVYVIQDPASYGFNQGEPSLLPSLLPLTSHPSILLLLLVLLTGGTSGVHTVNYGIPQQTFPNLQSSGNFYLPSIPPAMLQQPMDLNAMRKSQEGIFTSFVHHQQQQQQQHQQQQQQQQPVQVFANPSSGRPASASSAPYYTGAPASSSIYVQLLNSRTTLLPVTPRPGRAGPGGSDSVYAGAAPAPRSPPPGGRQGKKKSLQKLRSDWFCRSCGRGEKRNEL
eukprot:756023-Hanusia_phi.AAC.4